MSTSGKAKASARKKLLPVIPTGVEPAMSPHLTPPNLDYSQSPLLPRTVNPPSSNKKQTSGKTNSRVPGEGEDSAVRVAVRVRPFSKR